ncbi:hypothetical protein HMPREF3212_01113 [Citrobacter freundii]|nr:hypothetical protein HMPREF3212_01113 [Citrobacter freundii]
MVSDCAILHSALSRVAVHHQQCGHKQGAVFRFVISLLYGGQSGRFTGQLLR